MHLSGAPGDTSVWWLMALMEVPPPWRLSVHRDGDRPGAPAPPAPAAATSGCGPICAAASATAS